MQYKSDYASPLPFPDNFFKENAKNRSVDLQDWLSTAKFSRFAIRDAIAKDTALYVYMPEMNMTIHGEVSAVYSNASGASLVAYNTESNNVYDTTLDKDGHFRMAVDDFADGTSFFLQTMDKRSKPVDSKIILDNDSYPSVSPHEKYSLWQSEYAESKATVNGMKQGGAVARCRGESARETRRAFVDREILLLQLCWQREDRAIQLPVFGGYT